LTTSVNPFFIAETAIYPGDLTTWQTTEPTNKTHEARNPAIASFNSIYLSYMNNQPFTMMAHALSKGINQGPDLSQGDAVSPDLQNAFFVATFRLAQPVVTQVPIQHPDKTIQLFLQPAAGFADGKFNYHLRHGITALLPMIFP